MPSSSRSLILRLTVLLVIVVVAAGWAVKKYVFPGPWRDGLRSGGASLHVEIPGPVFRQFDAHWGSHKLGRGPGTLEQEGCTVCCLTMALRSKGRFTVPWEVDEMIEANHGFTDSGQIIWASVRAITEGHFEMVVPETPTYEEIDAQLTHGNPVLAKVYLANGLPHWVLLTGKHDLTYLVRDPLGDGTFESLDKYPRGIYAIRYLKAL